MDSLRTSGGLDSSTVDKLSGIMSTLSGKLRKIGQSSEPEKSEVWTEAGEPEIVSAEGPLPGATDDDDQEMRKNKRLFFMVSHTGVCCENLVG